MDHSPINIIGAIAAVPAPHEPPGRHPPPPVVLLLLPLLPGLPGLPGLGLSVPGFDGLPGLSGVPLLPASVSWQSGVPLPLASSATPHPHTPGAIFFGSFGHPSHASPTPSVSLSFWSGLATLGQLSLRPTIPSPSGSLASPASQFRRMANPVAPFG